MIARYRVLAERIRAEIVPLQHVVERAESALNRSSQQPANQEYFLAAAALDLHSFYSGVERLLEMIARDVDQSIPSGSAWHRDLLAQLVLPIPPVRPAVLTSETEVALRDYLGFRHVIRNVYTFDLKPDRVAELTRGLRAVFELVQRDLLSFAAFLDGLATADQDQ